MYHEQEKGNLIAVSPVAYYEIVRGFEESFISKRNKKFISFYENIYTPQYPDRRVMDISRQIYHALRLKGLTIEDNDIYIAVWSIVCGAVFVTDNIKHYKDIDGIKLENWL
jgi:predicted nucleic acid-binding protein